MKIEDILKSFDLSESSKQKEETKPLSFMVGKKSTFEKFEKLQGHTNKKFGKQLKALLKDLINKAYEKEFNQAS